MPTERDEVEKLFKPHRIVILSCLNDAFDRFYEINRDELGAIHSRTKASYINDLVVKYLREKLPDILKPQWESKRGQRRVWLAGSVCMRVKKVNQDLNPNNIATQAQFDFYQKLSNQQQRFNNMPAPIPLILGFTMNKTKTRYDKVFLIHADKVSNINNGGIQSIKPIVKWAIQITDDETPIGAEQRPIIHIQEPSSGIKHRIRIKNNKAKKSK
ncbi:MAG: hypothetical protein JW762_06470 [Dehalococcoidales bacterium]|nr:hypothetical protein [Dehalococcoidales bacterium]